MSSSPASARVPWHAILIGALTVGLLAIFLRNIDLRAAWAAMLAAHLGWIAGAAGVTLQTYLLRAWRWQAILQPIGRVSLETAFRTTVLGYAANFLLPARIGEILRPYLLARREHLDPAAAFATIVVERLLDLCVVLLLFALGLFSVGGAVARDTETAGILAAAASIGGFAALFLLAGHPDRLGRLASRLGRRLPPKAGQTFAHLVTTFVQGLRVMRSPIHLARAVAWSVPLWLSISLGIYMTSLAFDLTMPFAGSFLVVGYLTVGVAAPTPGAVGGFHAMYQLALTEFFHANPSVAGAAAIVLHLVSFVPVTLLGLVFMWQDGLTLGGLKGMRAEARHAEGASQS
jgi:uncharacterized protein (TIRG00374 family)